MSTVSFPYLGIEFTINRVAFSIGSFNVYWYGILIALGMLVGVYLAQKNAKVVGITEDNVLDIVIVAAVIAVFSGRAFYVLFADDYEIHSVKEFFNLRGGGTAFYGVLIGALVSSIAVCLIKKIPILPFLDLLGIGLLVGQGIGRWGNFFNQELFGTNTDLPWAMYSDTISWYVSQYASSLKSQHGIILEDAPVHPTFLYESLWCFIGLFILYRLLKKRRFDGEVFLSYLVWNGIGRAFIEQLRTDALFLGRIRISQFVCSLLALTAFVALLMIRSTIRRLNDDEYLMPYVKRKELEEAESADSENDSEENDAESVNTEENEIEGELTSEEDSSENREELPGEDPSETAEGSSDDLLNENDESVSDEQTENKENEKTDPVLSEGSEKAADEITEPAVSDTVQEDGSESDVLAE